MLMTWLLLTVSFLIAAAIVPGFQVRSFGGAIIAAALFGVLNFFIGWFIFIVLGLATLGIGFLLAFITRVITNAIVLKITDAMTSRLSIRSFGSAVLAAIVIGIVSGLGERLFHLKYS